ncbi:MAG: tRNA (adenosine(37)-N6)-threonylcarbamoyltransferase complex dimerization subunit type 1 TsaB [Candidatus Tectomicrobia bacterium RIFCSPLOWO2_12_FULL_69_37]|nr:MAG: tRNA (adenosine(37)-N6)-threonylcarbamoyltransferase complex dimerization subunit type 1 TsaB [Candidatus Tectomicrobia bacterium RIFCSPLOWO2_12_FULL_69_37]OGL64859.1 MAG: tRNA (adenosine(37)-N6)-threonylcarbamoyltransferase complex dimerization subunit type 1 TsaB [Candidatus Tectomicrobia bacterium RIFCSPLOWO2_02_FULL_70_19]
MPSGGRAWILGIDTSGAAGGLALLEREGETLAGRALDAGARSSRALMPALDLLLREAGVRREDLAAVGAATGPGTFTGLRIGLSTAKGLSLALGIPLYSVSSLEALALLAWRLRPKGEPPEWILPFRDARQGELFWARFEAPQAPGGLPRREGEDGVAEPSRIALPRGRTLAVGSDAALPPAWAAWVGVSHVALSTAAPAVARLAREALMRREPPAPPGLEPRYGREPRAMTQWGAPPGVDHGPSLT